MVRAEENSVIIENNGIGYRVFACGRDISRMANGSEVLLHTYLNVREDAMQLFGFMSADDLEVFRLLLSVNGIGPKAALGVLSGMTAAFCSAFRGYENNFGGTGNRQEDCAKADLGIKG